nr:zinc ABC transporter substrate-binding protein [Leucobacter insecticola]
MQPAAQRSAADPIQVVTTTGILADLARNVAGDRAEVTPLVPQGAIPTVTSPRCAMSATLSTPMLRLRTTLCSKNRA